MPAAAVAQQQKQLVASSSSSSSSSRLQQKPKMTTGGSKKMCSNPFRIPRHNSTSGLRLVRRLVRERLAHVSFGHHICIECRKRVHVMLKQRHQIKPSSRLSGVGVPEISLSPRPRSSPATPAAPAPATAAAVSGGRQSTGNVSKPQPTTTAAVAPPPPPPPPTPVVVVQEKPVVRPPTPPPPPPKQEEEKKKENVISPGPSAEASVIDVDVAPAVATPAAAVPNLAGNNIVSRLPALFARARSPRVCSTGLEQLRSVVLLFHLYVPLAYILISPLYASHYHK